MKTILLALLCFAFPAFGLTCHSTPTTDDRLFYDRAVVSAAKDLTWDGYNGNLFARSIIDRRRAAFAGLDAIPTSGPLTDDEGALYDAALTAAIEHAAMNMAGGPPWIDGTQAAQWAHGVAWVAMYYRMNGRC